MKRILLSIVIAAPLALLGCSKGTEAPANGTQKAAPQILSVKTSKAEGRTVERSVEATGTLMGWDEVAVSNEVPGIVEKINADLGDSVKAGDTLAVLDQREAKLNLADAEANLQTGLKGLEKEKARQADAATTFKRYDELFKQGMVSASQYDSAKTQYDVAQAQANEAQAKVDQASARLDMAKKRLSDTVIRAPISGEVRKRAVSVGEAVKDKTTLFSVVSTGRLKFRGSIAESSVPEVKAGQPVTLKVEAFKDRTFKGTLKRISPSVDVETRTLELEAEVPNPEGVLKPGFFAGAVISTKKEANVPFVPESAVYSFVGITKVFVIENGVAKERMVKTGVRQGDMVEVIDKLKPGDTVAITNLSAIFDGAKVKAEK
ncbi:MAG: efflux RND transporter periplasmic adaptor subunit [Deltaproteobacteria bacterium]|nr:efflux RND transporter periplasmic adaptor subunit [Deltaproteobacteria bacterium]